VACWVSNSPDDGHDRKESHRSQSGDPKSVRVTVHTLASFCPVTAIGDSSWNQEESNNSEGIGCPLKRAQIA
jgi:hypothetical protein